MMYPEGEVFLPPPTGAEELMGDSIDFLMMFISFMPFDTQMGAMFLLLIALTGFLWKQFWGDEEIRLERELDANFTPPPAEIMLDDLFRQADGT